MIWFLLYVIFNFIPISNTQFNTTICRADFKPSNIRLKYNHSSNVTVSLSCPDVSFYSNDAILSQLDFDGNTSIVSQFQLDDNFTSSLFLKFPYLGRFNYFIYLPLRPQVIVRGFLTVHVYIQRWAEILAEILGWTYFVLWSVSFYPQIVLNIWRRSVIGLSFDFVFINLVGFSLFTIYNCLIYFPSSVQNEYINLHPYSPLPVELNDVVFAAHAAICCAITAIQCCIFTRGDQRITIYGMIFIVASAIVVILFGILVAVNKFTLLNYITIYSYIKLASTLAKYIPQVYFNYARKSTVGWSISAILLDIAGGICSFAQQFVIAINFEKWSVIYGNVVKFLLAIASILFDVVFIIQHYILYRQQNLTDSLTGLNSIESGDSMKSDETGDDLFKNDNENFESIAKS